MIFKKGVHIKTRYDEMKKMDELWKNEIRVERLMKHLMEDLKEQELEEWKCIGRFDSQITGVAEFNNQLIVATKTALYTLKENPMYICGCGK